jgi:hypothetical protein
MQRFSRRRSVAGTMTGLVIAAVAASAQSTASAGVISYVGSQLEYDYGGAFPAFSRTAPQLDHSGNVIFLEVADGSDGVDLVKFDPMGSVIWTVPLSLSFTGFHMIVDGSNNVYVDNFNGSSIGNSYLVVTKVNSNGTIAWGGSKSFQIGGTDTEEFSAPGPMAFGPDGSLYLVGLAARTYVNFFAPVLLRIDPSTGALRNSRTLALSGDFSVGMDKTVLATDSAGNVYYGGPQGLWSFSQNLQTQRWSQSLMPRSIVVDSANGVLFVTGVGTAGTHTYNMFAARLSTSTGAIAWRWSASNVAINATYDGTNTGDPWVDERQFGGNQILLDSQGQVCVAGRGNIGGTTTGVIVKLSRSTGAVIWSAYASSGSVFAFANDDLDNLYVGGDSSEFLMLNSNGTHIWDSTGIEPPSRAYAWFDLDSIVVDRNGNSYWRASYETDDGMQVEYNEDSYHFIGNLVFDGTYTITGLNSGMALDDPGFSGTAGQQIQQYTVNNGSNQKWAVTNLERNTVRLVNQASGLTLGVRGGSLTNGAVVEQNVWTAASYQQWIVSPTNTPGYFTLKNVNSGQMLDVTGASKTPGAPIDQYPSNGNANQKWHFQ